MFADAIKEAASSALAAALVEDDSKLQQRLAKVTDGVVELLDGFVCLLTGSFLDELERAVCCDDRSLKLLEVSRSLFGASRGEE